MSFWNDSAKVCSSETCKDRCTNVTTVDDNVVECDCSPSCKALGRCCLDYEAVCEDRKGNWSITRLENATDIILKRKRSLFDDVIAIERTTFQTIDDVYWGRPPIKNGSGVFLIHNCYSMIRFCPDDFPTTSPFHDKCQSDSSDLLSIIPVSTFKTIYRNIYCALCNGFDLQKDEYFPWGIEYLCDENPESNQSIAMLSSNRTYNIRCQYVYKPPALGVSVNLFHCQGIIEKCPPSVDRDSVLSRTCNSYMAIIYLGRKLFKNYHCAICNMREFIKYATCFGRFNKGRPDVENTKGYKVRLPDFSRLVAFLKSSPPQYVREQTSKAARVVGDMLSGEPFTVKSNITKLPQLLNTNETVFHIHLRINSESNSTSTDIMRDIIERLLSFDMIDYYDESCGRMPNTTDSLETNDDLLESLQICCVVRPNTTTSSPKFGIQNITGILTSIVKTLCLSGLCSSNISYRVLNHLEVTFQHLCPIGSAVTYDVSEDVESILSNEKVFLNFKNHTYNIASLPMVYHGVIEYNRTDVDYITRNMSVSVCEFVLGNCSKLLLPDGTYEILNNGTVFIPKYNVYLTNDRFEFYKKEIVICSNYIQYRKAITDYFNDRVKGIMSLISITISLFSLFCTFIVYCMFPSLRTLAGKSLMNLVAAIFFGQLIFELSALPIGYQTPCLIVAVMQHYFFLAAFAWMNVLGYDLVSTFNTLALSALKGRKNKCYVRYVLVAWVSPLLVVLPCLFLHFFGNGNFGYGEKYICWLNGEMSLLVFFGIPLSISISINIVFFTYTAIRICKAAKDSQMVRKANSLELIVTVKMATLMGFTWLFSILSGFIRNDAFDYLFIMFNGSQGFFLFLAFVAKKSTFNLLKLKFGLKFESLSSSSQPTVLKKSKSSNKNG